jgi:prepilin-type N-terminal cleavage/methylation domain-containing protein
MAISAICRRRGSAGGFTLLELLLAMVLMGFLAALALPRLDQIYLRFAFWLDQDRVEREIAGLGARAYVEGRALRLASWPVPVPATGTAARAAAAAAAEVGEPVRLTLPEGWRVVVDPPILFRPDGACSGGSVMIEAGDVRRSFRLEPPRCRLK